VTDERGGFGSGASLEDALQDDGTGGSGELGQFVEGFIGAQGAGWIGAAFLPVQPNQDGAFGRGLRLCR
jgi:hypothetical protein